MKRSVRTARSSRCRRLRRVAFVLPLAGLLLVLTFAPAHPQVLPRVDLPDLPVELPVDVNDPLAGRNLRLDPRELRNVRLLRIRGLLREHRDVLEPDPRGAPVLRGEVIAFSPSEAALDQAMAAGFRIARARSLAGLDARIVVLKVPPRLSTRRALGKLQALDPDGAYDFNHIYTESGVTGPASQAGVRAGNTPHEIQPAGTYAAGPDAAVGPAASAVTKIGLIDGGIDLSHPVFHGARIETRGCEGRHVASSHGTAVASLMVGNSSQFHGSVPGATLYAADVYCGEPTGGAVDAIADAFAWLARERVPTINVSLVGPANVLLERTVRAVIARGHVVIAAVGNDGPTARPLYPAAYPGVVGVTAVDAKRRALLEACRGPHVDFSAPGADMTAAGTGAAFLGVRGTSFAAPIVSGLVAARLADPQPALSATAVAQLASVALDLGARGPDPTYGNGLVGEEIRAAASARQ